MTMKTPRRISHRRRRPRPGPAHRRPRPAADDLNPAALNALAKKLRAPEWGAALAALADLADAYPVDPDPTTSEG